MFTNSQYTPHYKSHVSKKKDKHLEYQYQHWLYSKVNVGTYGQRKLFRSQVIKCFCMDIVHVKLSLRPASDMKRCCNKSFIKPIYKLVLRHFVLCDKSLTSKLLARLKFIIALKMFINKEIVNSLIVVWYIYRLATTFCLLFISGIWKKFQPDIYVQ